MDKTSHPAANKSWQALAGSSVENRIPYLQSTRFLQYAPESLIRQLAQSMDMLRVNAGQRIVEKGENGDTMYFVIEGNVRVHDGDIDLNHLRAGDTFGEIAALSVQRRTASITADSDTLLYTINQSALYRALNNRPEAARSIIQGLCDNESQFVNDVIEQSVKVNVLERELEIGQRIQQGFLPDDNLEIEGWSIESHFKAAREVAGDFYDYFEIKSLGRMAFVIGDVCDKGVGAALFMSLFRSLIRSSALSFDYAENNKLSADDVLVHSIRLVNQYVATTHAKDSMFATIFFALLDPESGEISYINAGHEAPCIQTANGEVRRLDTSGPVVGLFPEAKFRVRNDTLQQGDILLAFTDGITEAKNSNNDEFGEHNVLDVLDKSASKTSAAKEVISNLLSAVDKFSGNTKQFDDITVLCLEHLKRHRK